MVYLELTAMKKLKSGNDVKTEVVKGLDYDTCKSKASYKIKQLQECGYRFFYTTRVKGGENGQ